MLVLLQNNYFFLLYFAALIFSTIRYSVYYDTTLKYLPVLIAYTLLSEILGFAVRNFDDIQIVYSEEFYYYNTVIFNIFDIIFYLYFLSVYSKTLTNTNSKMFVKTGIIAFVIVSIINLSFQDFYIDPQNFAIITGSLFTVASALLYVVQLNKNNKVSNTKDLLFWINIGIIFFHCCYPITMYILSFEYDIYTSIGLSAFHYFSISILYSCFIVGFIKMRRAKPYDLAS